MGNLERVQGFIKNNYWNKDRIAYVGLVLYKVYSLVIQRLPYGVSYVFKQVHPQLLTEFNNKVGFITSSTEFIISSL